MKFINNGNSFLLSAPASIFAAEIKNELKRHTMFNGEKKQIIQIIPKTIIQTAQMILNHKLIKRIRRVMDQIVLIAAEQQIFLITD